MNPTEWFVGLSDSIKNTRCRRRLADTTLDIGFDHLRVLFQETRSKSKTVYWIGNGGSNAICTHLSQDVMNKLNLRSFALNDASLLSCMSNDFGYENSFSKPVGKMISDGDLLIAISSSGNSENILRAVEKAHEKGAKIVTLSSFNDDNKLFTVDADLSFYLPAKLYGHAELGHAALLHAAIECLFLSENK